mmetsp:Transcript_6310/g.4755  ORF Transcript_6310/g.4755 Transcript_6310/m.4755 type:complete len:127 (+) Transcript_6310:913-1293(+)
MKVDQAKTNPGPGAYNVEKDSIAYKNLEKLAQGMFSSMFQAKNQQQSPYFDSDHKQKVVLPGPGQYSLPGTISEERLPSAMNIFKSDSVRDFGLGQVKRGPGPAYYKPQDVAATRIYNFNPKSKWI